MYEIGKIERSDKMRIGIIGAMDNEVQKFIELLGLTKDDSVKKEVYKGTYEDKNIYVIKSGIGKVNSAAITQFLIDEYHPDLIINSGCAGSLVSNLKILDVALAEYVTYHDFNPLPIMEEAVPNHGKIYSDRKLISIACEAIQSLENKNYQIVPICSGDSFVTSKEQREEIKIRTGAKVVDMESASIGHIATLNQIPFIAIRTISDFSDGEEYLEEEAALRSSHLVLEMIQLL